MPGWGIHLIVANNVMKKFDFDKDLFLLGNLLPDIQNGYLIKNVSNVIPHSESHYDGKKWSYENFYDLYKSKMDNSIVIGYYTHLLTDYLWNKMYYDRCVYDENNNFKGYYDKNKKIIIKNKSEANYDKQNDYHLFEKKIFDINIIEVPKYNSNIIKQCNIIDKLNINKQDVKNALEYIYNIKYDIKNNKEFKIFSQKDLEEYLEYTIKYIIKSIYKINFKKWKDCYIK